MMCDESFFIFRPLHSSSIRLLPVYNHTIMNGTTEDPYHNPGAPVYITSGSAGCYSKTDGFKKHPQPWSAFRDSDFGYGRMIVFNDTHL